MLPTDKFENNYVSTYVDLAGRIGPHGRVCEIGVDGGGSLELWQQLFPQGVVVGVDHNALATWPAGTIRVVADQTNSQLVDGLVGRFAPYDLIVDDASHKASFTEYTLAMLWPLVHPGGWYVIEDWGVAFRGHAPSYEPDMLTLAMSLIRSFEGHTGEGEWLDLTDLKEITYRGGMIIIQKQTQLTPWRRPPSLGKQEK